MPVCFVVTNGSNNRSASAGAMPGPVSATVTDLPRHRRGALRPTDQRAMAGRRHTLRGLLPIIRAEKDGNETDRLIYVVDDNEAVRDSIGASSGDVLDISGASLCRR